MSKRDVVGRILAVLFIAGVAYWFNRYGILKATLAWLESFGPWAPAGFVAVYILTAIFFVPSFVFTFAAGVLFGLPGGLALALAGSGLGAVSAFLIGRYLARPWAEKMIGRNAKFQTLIQAMSQKGWKIVLLARLSPIFPFMIANYAFGLTRLSARAYLAASLLGSLPSTTVYVYLGSVIGELALLGSSTRDRTPVEWALLIMGLLATVVLTLYIRRVSKAALEQNLSGPR